VNRLLISNLYHPNLVHFGLKIYTWYKTKSEILELGVDIGNIPFSEVKETLENGLSIKIDDCIDNSVSEWF
jgi:hypothetical protein